MLTNRRNILKSLAAATIAGGATGFSFKPSNAAGSSPILRRIPSSGETIPAVGLGSWITFNVGNDPALLDECTA